MGDFDQALATLRGGQAPQSFDAALAALRAKPSVRETASRSLDRIKAGTDFPPGTDTAKQGWLESSDVLGTPIGAAEAHPLDTAMGAAKALDPAPAIVHGVEKAQQERVAALARLHAGKAGLSDLFALIDPGVGQMVKSDADTRVAAAHRAIDQPLGPETTSDAFAAAVPFLGPALDQAGKQMRSPDPHQRAEGIGGGAAIVGTMVAPKVLPPVADAMSGAADASALGRMTKVTGDAATAKELIANDAVRMTDPRAEIAAYADRNIPKDIPEPARAGQFQSADVRQLRGQEAKYTKMRDEIAPNAMEKPDLPSMPRIALDAAKATGKGMSGAALPAILVERVLGPKAAVLGDIAVGSARGMAVVGSYIKDVLSSPKWQGNIADLQIGFAKAVRARDVNGIAKYGQAIIGGNDAGTQPNE